MNSALRLELASPPLRVSPCTGVATDVLSGSSQIGTQNPTTDSDWRRILLAAPTNVSPT